MPGPLPPLPDWSSPRPRNRRSVCTHAQACARCALPTAPAPLTDWPKAAHDRDCSTPPPRECSNDLLRDDSDRALTPIPVWPQFLRCLRWGCPLWSTVPTDANSSPTPQTVSRRRDHRDNLLPTHAWNRDTVPPPRASPLSGQKEIEWPSRRCTRA